MENAARPELRVWRGHVAGRARLVTDERVQASAIMGIGAIAGREDVGARAWALENMQ